MATTQPPKQNTGQQTPATQNSNANSVSTTAGTEIAQQQQSATPPAKTGTKAISDFLMSPTILQKFQTAIGEKANAFIISVLGAVNANAQLKDADPITIYTAALTAASLDLPINPNLGYAYLIPFKTKAETPQERVECQFQIGAKGFKQLAQRTGLYKRITDAIVYEGQLTEENPLDGFQFDWSKPSTGKIIGYVSKIVLLNGFENIFYMSVEKMEAHALEFSQTYKSKQDWIKKSSKWTTNFDAMALKTVTKLNLSKNGPMSVEYQQGPVARALAVDQAVIRDAETMKIEYVDAVTVSDTAKAQIAENANLELAGFTEAEEIPQSNEGKKEEATEQTKKSNTINSSSAKGEGSLGF